MGLESLIQTLNHTYSPDFWWDVERFRVGELLDAQDDSGWEQLLARIHGFSETGQANLAEACTLTKHPWALRALVLLLKSDSLRVGAAVVDSLLEMNYTWNPDESILADLKRHLSQADGYEYKQINRLISRLPS